MEQSIAVHIDYVRDLLFSQSNNHINIPATQFSVRRRTLVTEVIVLLKTRVPRLHEIFKCILEHRGMAVSYFDNSDKQQACYLSGDTCTHLRKIAINDVANFHKSFLVRSDMVYFIQCFYCFAHWEEYVMLQIYDNDAEHQNQEWQQKLIDKYTEIDEVLRAMLKPLHVKSTRL